MLDRYDPRDDDGHTRSGSDERHQGSRGGGDRDSVREDGGRNVFGRQLDLPRGPHRELVRDRKRSYDLNGPESEALATIGAFRMVHADDLRQVCDPDRGQQATRNAIRHLQESGLLERIPLESRSRDVVVLTKGGRDLLEANGYERDDRSHESRQTFYAGLRKPRELTHDAQVYRAYLHAEERLRGGGARVRRVVLDYELKRECQQFLQDRNRGRADSTGRPDRDPEEIAAWAREHDLPFFDAIVHAGRIIDNDMIRQVAGAQPRALMPAPKLGEYIRFQPSDVRLLATSTTACVASIVESLMQAQAQWNAELNNRPHRRLPVR